MEDHAQMEQMEVWWSPSCWRLTFVSRRFNGREVSLNAAYPFFCSRHRTNDTDKMSVHYPVFNLVFWSLSHI